MRPSSNNCGMSAGSSLPARSIAWTRGRTSSSANSATAERNMTSSSVSDVSAAGRSGAVSVAMDWKLIEVGKRELRANPVSEPGSERRAAGRIEGRLRCVATGPHRLAQVPLARYLCCVWPYLVQSTDCTLASIRSSRAMSAAGGNGDPTSWVTVLTLSPVRSDVVAVDVSVSPAGYLSLRVA